MNNETLTRQKLYKLAWSIPMTTLAKKYNTSDAALRKICVKMNIPLPKAGHWEKVRVGKSVEILELPSDYTGEEKVTLPLKINGIDSNNSSPILARQQELENSNIIPLSVPDKLTSPHRLIIEAKAELLRPGKYLREGTVRTKNEQLDIRVSPKNVGRALRFMDTFIKAIYVREHKIEIRRDTTYLVIAEEEIEIMFREKLKRIVVKDTWERTELIPTDVLSFRAKVLFSDFEWNDSKALLETKLSQIIAKLEIKAKEAQEERSIWKQARDVQEEKRKIEREKQERAEKEANDFKRLLNESKQWKEFIVLGEYLNTIEQKAKEDNTLSEDLINWLRVVRQKAELYNPLEQRIKEMELSKNLPAISPQ